MTDGPRDPEVTGGARAPAGASLFDTPGFARRHVAVPFAVWALGAAVFETTSLDLVLSDPFYDPVARKWYGLHEWFTGQVLYYGGRRLIVAVGVALLAASVASLRFPRFAAWRRSGVYVALCMAATGTAVGALKALIDRATPSDYDRYGGDRPYTRLFEAVPPGFEPIHQFPAAHPSGAFALLALYFVGLSRGARRPWLWLLPGVLMGSFYAWVQQIRGMHFASHDWWTAGIAWAVALGMLRLFRGRL